MRKRILGIALAVLVTAVIAATYLALEAHPCDSVTYYAFGNAIKVQNCEK